MSEESRSKHIFYRADNIIVDLQQAADCCDRDTGLERSPVRTVWAGDEHCATWRHSADFLLHWLTTLVGWTMWPNSAPLRRTKLGRVFFLPGRKPQHTVLSLADRKHKPERLILISSCSSVKCCCGPASRRGPAALERPGQCLTALPASPALERMCYKDFLDWTHTNTATRCVSAVNDRKHGKSQSSAHERVLQNHNA